MEQTEAQIESWRNKWLTDQKRMEGSDRSPRNQQVAHRIGSGRNVLFLVELRQTEPFGWRTPLGEETAIPVVCFFIVESEICFHKYRKHRLTFYIFIGYCTASSSWTVHGDMFTLCVTCGSNMLKSAGVAWWGKRRENNWGCDFIMNWFNVFTTSCLNE